MKNVTEKKALHTQGEWKVQEQWEQFWRKGRPLVQYDYRHNNGMLFTTVAPTVQIARARRDQWKEAIERPNPELK